MHSCIIFPLFLPPFPMSPSITSKSLPAFSMQTCIRTLVSFAPRQGKGEQKAAEYLQSVLKQADIPFTLQRFSTRIPVMKSARLLCDGKPVEAEACAFVSGDIADKHTIVSSAMPSRYCSDVPNISFNPSCPVFSPGNHYFAPALTVTHAGLQKVLAATKVEGQVRVQPTVHRSANILIGNLQSPRVICFAHYDSIKKGAIDNASGVAVLLKVLLSRSDLRDECLFVLAGNEELSYDCPTYWGHGFRVFEKAYLPLLRKAKRIIPVDCVGNGHPLLLTDPGIVSRAFPLQQSPLFARKTTLLTGDIDQLMQVYHSDRDDGRGLTAPYLDASVQALESLLQTPIRVKSRKAKR